MNELLDIGKKWERGMLRICRKDAADKLSKELRKFCHLLNNNTNKEASKQITIQCRDAIVLFKEQNQAIFPFDKNLDRFIMCLKTLDSIIDKYDETDDEINAKVIKLMGETIHRLHEFAIKDSEE